MKLTLLSRKVGLSGKAGGGEPKEAHSDAASRSLMRQALVGFDFQCFQKTKIVG